MSIARRLGPTRTARAAVVLAATFALVLVATVGAYAASGDRTDIATGLTTASGIAVAPDGTRYVADAMQDHILQIAPDGTTTLFDQRGETFAGLAGLAIDADGALYVADVNNNRVLRYPAGSGAPTSYTAGLDRPISVAVGPDGTVYIGTYGGNNVLRFPVSGLPDVLRTDLANPAIAVSADGVVWITDLLDHTIERIDGATTTTYTLPANTEPSAIAIGPQGEIVVTAWGSNGRLIRYLPGTGAIEDLWTTSPPSNPQGLVFDAAGDLYVATGNTGTATRIELPFPPPPTTTSTTTTTTTVAPTTTVTPSAAEASPTTTAAVAGDAASRAPEQPGALAFTGSATGRLVLVAIGLLLVGGALRVVPARVPVLSADGSAPPDEPRTSARPLRLSRARRGTRRDRR